MKPFARNTRFSEIRMVTPEMAREMLLNNVNRPVIPTNLRVLVGAISRGEWRTTHQGIAFDKHGNLVDGQHRLLACIATGIPITVEVTFGLDPEDRDAMDGGRIRTVGNHLDLDARIAQPLRLASSFVYSNTALTIPQIRDVAATGISNSLGDLVTFCGSTSRVFSSAGVRLAAGICLLAGRPKDHVLTQYRAMVLMSFDACCPAALSLIKQSQSSKASAAGSSTRELFARALRVFDPMRASTSRIQIADDDVAKAVRWCKDELSKRMAKRS